MQLQPVGSVQFPHAHKSITSHLTHALCLDLQISSLVLYQPFIPPPSQRPHFNVSYPSFATGPKQKIRCETRGNLILCRWSSTLADDVGEDEMNWCKTASYLLLLSEDHLPFSSCPRPLSIYSRIFTGSKAYFVTGYLWVFVVVVGSMQGSCNIAARRQVEQSTKSYDWPLSSSVLRQAPRKLHFGTPGKFGKTRHRITRLFKRVVVTFISRRTTWCDGAGPWRGGMDYIYRMPLALMTIFPFETINLWCMHSIRTLAKTNQN